MASIIKNDAQIKALKEITEGVETVKVINTIMEGNAAGAYFGIGEKAKAVRIEVNPKEAKAFVTYCGKVKARLAKEIYAKADKFAISLDADDLAAIGPQGKQAEDE